MRRSTRRRLFWGTFFLLRRAQRPKRLKGKCSLYRLYAKDNTLLYVGISCDPQRRFFEHSQSKVWWPYVSYSHIKVYRHRRDAAKEELKAIRKEHPVYNVSGRVR